jgi:hypothetical protein
MALIRCDFFADSLEQGTSMTVLLPQVTQTRIGGAEQARPRCSTCCTA